MLISNAYAQSAGTTADPMGGFMGLPFIILMFVLMYFMIIRPQQKRTKEHKSLLEALQKGDEVVTQGGIAGKIVDVGDAYVRIEIASNTEILVQKPAIAGVLPKGTLKSV
ncbi:MAG: preprotein translocase subunit YajC [Betaproteobacteria bacterium]|nr:preprotein translocase subunit YajC [Betaproteobacteria bacterium]